MKLKKLLSVICTAALLMTSFSAAAVPVSAQTADSTVVSGDEGGGYDEPEENDEQGEDQDGDAPKVVGDTYDYLIEVTDEHEIEQLDGAGWFLRDDGTLIVGGPDWYFNWMDHHGENKEKVTSVYLGYRYKKLDSLGNYRYSAGVVDHVPEGAFNGCPVLKNVVFPRKNFSYIEDGAFEHCSQLGSVVFYTPVALGYRAFGGDQGLKSATFFKLPVTYSTDYRYAGEQTDEPEEGILADGGEGTKGYLYPVSDDDDPPFKTCPFVNEAFEGTPGDFVIHVPGEDCEQLKVIYPEYADQFVGEDTSTHFGLSVNGTVLSEQNTTVQCGDGTAAFDAKTNTLTLENATLTKSKKLTESEPGDKKNLSREDSAIYSTLADLTIVLKGKNTFGTYVMDHNYEEAYSAKYAPTGEMYMVRSSGSVTIEGGGTLQTLLMRGENDEYVLTDKECTTRIAANGDVSFDGVELRYIDVAPSLYEEYEDTGVVTLKDSTLIGADIVAPSGFVMKNSSLAVSNKAFNTEFGYVYENNDVKVRTGDITLENSTLERTALWSRSSFSGDDRPESDITAKDLTLIGCDVRTDGSINITGLSAGSNSEDEVSYRTDNGSLADINRILGGTVTISGSGTAKYITIYGESGENTDAPAAAISGIEIYDGTVRTKGDLVMDKAKFAGTKLDVTGSLKMTECTSYAEYENQNSPIVVNGDGIDIIGCDFEGIAKTNKGERQVDIGNGLPMIEVFEYSTLSGVSLDLYSEEDRELTLNLKDSRLMLQRIGTGNSTKINIDETRMLMCNSIFGYGDPGFDYDNNITITGNIAIVTGGWGMNNETGIFIDYLGDYFTFDEETGLLCLNNSYGARGWRQRTEYWDNDAREDKIRTEITDKVKKIIVGGDVDWDIGVSFAGYKNVTEVEIGDGVHVMNGDQLEGCVSLEKITLGTGIEYFTDDVFEDCPKLKTIVLEGEVKPSDYTRQSTFDRNDVNLNIIVPSALEEKYKTMIFPRAKNMINRSEKPVYYPLTVNGEIFTSDNLTVKCGDGTAAFDPETNTLTLDNATITKYARVSPSDDRWAANDGVIESRLDDLTIVLNGDNVMRWSDPNAGSNGNGIDAWGAVTITGGGTLEIECEEKIYNEDYKETKTPKIHSTGDMVIDGAAIRVTYSDNWEEDPFFGKSYADKLSVNSNTHYNDYTHGTVPYTQKPITIINSTLDDVDLDPKTDERLRISNSTINGTYYEKNDSVNVPDKPADPTVKPMYGDLDGDGKITANDALMILRSSVNTADLTPEQTKLADVDVDGSITANDALAVLRCSVGMGDGGNVGKERA